MSLAAYPCAVLVRQVIDLMTYPVLYWPGGGDVPAVLWQGGSDCGRGSASGAAAAAPAVQRRRQGGVREFCAAHPPVRTQAMYRTMIMEIFVRVERPGITISRNAQSNSIRK